MSASVDMLVPNEVGVTWNDTSDSQYEAELYQDSQPSLTAAPKKSGVRGKNRSPRTRRGLLLPQRRCDRGKLSVVLDIDETLVHTQFTGSRDYRQAEDRLEATCRAPDMSFVLYEDDDTQEDEVVFVWVRPGLERFLKELSEIAEPIVWTASLPCYARPLLKLIDPNRLARSRLYRNACVEYKGFPYVKALKNLGRDLRRTVILDNSPAAMIADPYNSVLVKPYYDDPNDCELDNMLDMIKDLVPLPDVRQHLHERFRFIDTVDQLTN